jgi:hypothetical protein
MIDQRHRPEKASQGPRTGHGNAGVHVPGPGKQSLVEKELVGGPSGPACRVPIRSANWRRSYPHNLEENRFS